jgi:Zn-dependent alcohol dehydrogenase
MRAAILETAKRPLIVTGDVAIRAPGPDEVLVRVRHCGVCHSDLSIVDGAFPSPLPIVLGHEAAGVVEAVGPGVAKLAPGDPVVLTACPPCGACYWCVRGEASLCEKAAGIYTGTHADGTTGLSRAGGIVYRGLGVAAFAEYVVTAATGAIRIPEDVPLDVACVIGCAVQTGVGAVLNVARLEEGDTVLVLGLGGIGLSVVQGARLAGAARIFASDPVPERRKAAEAFGATDVLDPACDDVATFTREATRVGVDFAFETAGRARLIETGLESVRNGGSVVCVGAPPLGEDFTLPPAAAFAASQKRLLGCLLGGCNSLREIPRLISLWQAGRLDLASLVTRRRPLEEINEAMQDLRAYRGIRTVLSI